MSVTIGSARIDERGKITGGQAGDQNGGKEVSTQSWYKHSKGWRVFRCIDAAKAILIALCMKNACANNHIGYDQAQRNTLYNAIKAIGFDVTKLTKDVETDCSALVRVCLAFAGITVADFNTSSEATRLLSSGQFIELTESKYRNGSEFLRAGDILVTSVKGHTAIVLTNGSKAEPMPAIVPDNTFGSRTLRNGSTGADVIELQNALISIGYSCGSWGADGDFGDATEGAVREFQKDHDLEIDGVVGVKTFKALTEAANAEPNKTGSVITIFGGKYYLRTSPSKDASIIGVLRDGTTHEYLGSESEGFYHVKTSIGSGWVSVKGAMIGA